MKHRAGSSKIKYEHAMIHGLRDFLEKELEPLDYVEAIFPGEIRRTKGTSSGFKVRFKYTTKTGVKLLAYAPSVVQEVFVITKDPEALRRFVEKREGF
ncbi:MAG: DUF2103 domain-containing protein [bacterium]